MRCSGRFAHLQSSSFIEMSLKFISGVLVDIEIIWVRDWEAVGDGCWKEIYGGKKLVEKQGFGTTGANCKQLFASIMLRLHFNKAFPGIHVILAWGCALSGDLCLRTEQVFCWTGVFIAVMFYFTETKSPRCDLDSTDPVVCVDWFCSVRFLKFVYKKNLL